jgi:glycosyltransferase involved in cell wall biosynthesis
MTNQVRSYPAKPLVTALIDTYNYGHFVEEAIESVLAQDYPSERIEVLVVDDGSTDDTAERVKKYGKRIQYLLKPNGGQGSAFNFGFEKAQGEIIAFLDADDYWLPQKLSRVVRSFEEHPGVGLVYHRRRELNSSTGEFGEGDFSQCSGFLPDNLKELLDYRVLPTSSLVFSREVLARMMPMPDWIRLQADAFLALLVVFLAPVEAISEELCVYRIHGKNLFATDARASGQQQKHLSMRKAIYNAVKTWLADHDFDLNRRDIMIFFERLSLFLEVEEFEYIAPSRAEFFNYMSRYTRLYWNSDRWKLRLMNSFNTLAGLLIGYEKFSGLYKAEVRAIGFLQRLTSRHP